MTTKQSLSERFDAIQVALDALIESAGADTPNVRALMALIRPWSLGPGEMIPVQFRSGHVVEARITQMATHHDAFCAITISLELSVPDEAIVSADRPNEVEPDFLKYNAPARFRR
jgi:hypothetical protein